MSGTCEVIGTLADVGLAPVAGAELLFEPLPNTLRRYLTTVVVPTIAATKTDAFGAFSVHLVAGRYRLTVISDIAGVSKTVVVTVPSSATAYLAEILNISVSTTTPGGPSGSGFSGFYADLIGIPDPASYATATQGMKADSALQPAALVASVRTLWVDPAGSDTAAGDLPTSPLKTIRAAVARAMAGDVIRVRSGIYVEECPIVLPRDVSVFGDGLRNVEVRPTDATKNNHMWLVDSGAYLWGMTFARHQAGSFAVAFNADANNTAIGASGLGAFILKSPYIQNCSSYTAAQDSGVAGSVSTGVAGGGMEVDGAKCAPNSPIRSMVVDSYTQVNLNGPGCLVKNDAYAQLVSFFGTFCSYHVRAESGGQVNLSNSTTNFGTFGLVANGRSTTPVFSGTAASAAVGATALVVNSMTASRIGPASRPVAGMVFEVDGSTYTITGAVPNGSGWTVNFFPALSASVLASTTVPFFQRSQISTGGHVMEFVGSGTNYNALPWYGGVPVPANEIVEQSGGRVFFSSTDQLGNFRVGPQFDVNGTTGAVTINTDKFNLSGLNAIGPFSRDGFTAAGVQLREVSNDVNLASSTGVADGNTAPTQFAVKTYLDTNYSKTNLFGSVAFSNSYADLTNKPTLSTVAGTGSYNDLLNKPNLSAVAGSVSYTDLTNKPPLGTAAATDSAAYATAAQGILASTAVQPASLAPVATSGVYADLTGKPVLGTAAATNATDYATAAQGTLASTAVQPSSLAAVASTGAYADLTGKPTLGTAAALNVGTTANQVVQLDASGKLPALDASQLTNIGAATGVGDVSGPSSAVSNHVALFDGTSGKLIKSSGTALGTAASTSSTDYATAAQGTLASTAVQPGSLATVATTGAYSSLSGLPTLGTLSAQNANAATFTGFIREAVFAVNGTTPALNPANGTIQTWTLTGASTPTFGLSAGDAITLLIDDGTGFTITWPTTTWVNNKAAAPTLSTTKMTVIALWKVGSTLYGALVGDGS